MKKLFYFLSFMILFTACHKDDDAFDFSKKELEITSGYVCGWCAGADSIVMVNDVYKYNAFNPCAGEAINNQEKTGTVQAEQWNELVQLLDFDDFLAIDINTCHVCADGCDYWVRIRQGNETHEIRYGSLQDDSLTLAPVWPFLEKLDSLKNVLISE